MIENQPDIRNYALILAGGSGKRMGNEIPKQFVEIAGKPVLIHTLENFQAYDPQISIILVLPKEQTDFWKNLCGKYHCNIPHTIVEGGKERFFSVQNGLNAITGEGIVFIHDGVRPLVSHDTLRRCQVMAETLGNAIPAIPVAESVRYMTEESSHPVDRTRLRLIQTPQTFRISLIKKAYRQPYSASFTDDASVLEQTGEPVHLTEGNRENIKITWPYDLSQAEQMLASYLKTSLKD